MTPSETFCVIDLVKAVIEKRIPIKDAGFPNDVRIDGKGVFYLTDSQLKAVYRIENGVAQLWLVSEKIATWSLTSGGTSTS